MDWEGNIVCDVDDAGVLVGEVLILERATVDRPVMSKYLVWVEEERFDGRGGRKTSTSMPFEVHEKEITRAYPISHVARILAHRTDSLASTGGIPCPAPD
jgi:hypothetical protein